MVVGALFSCLTQFFVMKEYIWADTQLCPCQSPVNDEQVGKRILYMDIIDGTRLGNHMFMVASLYGLARSSNRVPVINKNILRRIDLPFPRVKNKVTFGIVPASKNLLMDIFWHYTSSVKETILESNNSTITLFGCFISWFYFHDYMNDIKEMFIFSHSILTQAKADLNAITARINASGNITYVAIHVRRGDRAHPNFLAEGAKLPPRSYYQQAMDYFRKKYTSVHFIVCSDTPTWCHKNIHAPDVHFPSGERHVLVDLALMTLCNHTIMSVGTFGWWAGFLAGGDVIYYSEPYEEGTKMSEEYVAGDFVLPEWIPLPWMCWSITVWTKQSGRHFEDGDFKCILLTKNVNLEYDSLLFVPWRPMKNKSALVQVVNRNALYVGPSRSFISPWVILKVLQMSLWNTQLIPKWWLAFEWI